VALVWGVELAIGVPVLRLLGRLGPRPRNRAEWSSVARASLFEAAGFVAVSIALGRAPTSVVSPLSSLSTAGSVLLGVLLLRERMARWALVGAACASLGVVLVNL
jgi:drug/metabolite transporter (DMT)-like permease